ncbi:MAG TPA: EAL domain-containing protein [Candidatus Limnocylindrales bacterium]|nr:EAL domain-containing protein [Candidatus Limnocylindrales bacterium]
MFAAPDPSENDDPAELDRAAVVSELARTTQLLQTIIDSSPFATMAFDREQRIVLWSGGAERLFGWTPDEVLGKAIPAGMVPAGDRGSSQARIRRTLKGAPVSGDLVIRRTKDGREIAVEIHAGPLLDDAGRTIGYAGHMVDVTRLREVELDLALVGRVAGTLAGAVARVSSDDPIETTAQAICDELRSLPSVDLAAVGAFHNGADTDVLAASAEPGIPITAGASLPVHRSRALRERAASGPWAQEWDPLPEDGAWGRAMTAAGIRAFAFGPIVHGGHLDGGIVIGTRDPSFARTLVDKWATLVDFSTAPSALLAERLHAHRHQREIRESIAGIIAERAFGPAFQPIVELASGDVMGHEALTRFTSGRRPDLVFADAQAAGIGIDLELATLEAAIAAAHGLPAGRWLDVNVSPQLLDDPAALRAVLSVADRPVVLEITEHEVIGDYDAFRAAVRSLGHDIRLAVDDAGAGVANFGHIIDLGPDFVKLDQSLIRRVNAHLGRQALIVGMRYFSRASGCRLVAEGIETEEERRTLLELGIEFGQGHWYGEPEPVRVRPSAVN